MRLPSLISLSETTQSLLQSENANLIAIPSATPFLVADQAQEKQVLLVAHSSQRATELAQELAELIDGVMEFPAWETLPHEKLSPNSDTVARRVQTLLNLDQAKVIVTSARALVQPIVSSAIELPILKISRGQEIEFETLISNLVLRAYNRVDMVERRGDFAVRGGIIDVFPPLSAHPVRIEFFGDEIEELKFFEISDQRSFEAINSPLTLIPCREVLITEDVKARAHDLKIKYPELIEMCNKIEEGIYVEGIESLAAVLSPKMKTLVEYLSNDAKVIFLEQERIKSRVQDLISTNQEFLAAAWSNIALTSKSDAVNPQIPLRTELQIGAFVELDKLKDLASDKGISWNSINSFGFESDLEIKQFSEIEPYRNKVEKLIADVRNYMADGYLVVISVAGHGLQERYRDIFQEADIPAVLKEKIDTKLVRGTLYLISSAFRNGFEDVEKKILFITEAEITGSRDNRISATRMPSRRKKSIDPLELKSGDFVVHEQHGVGRYIELVQRTVGGASREYLVIEYAASKRGQPADRIYVPTDALEQITRYVGGETPAVNRIGGGDWIKTKARAKKAVKEIAGELIRLYAARTSSPGFAFSPDTTWQRELEDSFAYVETPDQLVTINEVKADMEKPYPMDRIVCGDVGYGKTEIAIRAAFKAVQDGKQVAVLVPTTLLAQQHFATFTQRYAGFPIKVAGLSRFNSTKEINEALKALASGAVDVVIGTHRLLSEDVAFRDLGLIIVDEEQRFGVEHKEKLKKLRASVDVLAMSATPIPRTLEMAITGIREMSTIATPPEERHPVLTYVGAYDDKQVAAAIHRELLRDGQVFYIHNRVESIDEVATRIRKLVPEARVAIAHGQMNEAALEQVVVAFWNREFDVLVSTTIVENGIDVANANTLIVERSDVFGLSQLHQLRGRVGRGRERAYAYFLYPADKPLTELALDRLTTIAKNTELGAGMQVALKDLEIRGAGNLLGGEQSGHIADVGFDLYMRMVGEAVNEFKRGVIDGIEENLECKVELPITAHLSPEYVPSDRLRLDLYRRLADAKDDAEIDAIKDELVDRFGALPKESNALLQVAKLRTFVKAHGITDFAVQGRYVKVAPLQPSESLELMINRLYPGSIVKSVTKVVMIARPQSAAWESAVDEIGDTSLLDWAFELAQTLLERPKRK
ncbi:MAG: transcription-repair coupling factor [Candidatus Nanopelagicaceae bacterium]|nr:transcription-repair coupling factor [Candidatus Nanopelagicaceae bacterium]